MLEKRPAWQDPKLYIGDFNQCTKTRRWNKRKNIGKKGTLFVAKIFYANNERMMMNKIY